MVKNNLAGMHIGLVVECSQCVVVEGMLTGRWHQLQTGLSEFKQLYNNSSVQYTCILILISPANNIVMVRIRI